MTDHLETVIAATDLTPEQRAGVETAESNGHRAVKEPLVYQLHARHSYFADMALASLKGDSAAGERIDRHTRQMAAIPTSEARSLPGAEYEYRVNPNLEAGHGLEFTVPLWLNQYFATAPRAGECIQRLVREKGNEFELPPGVSSIAVPRLTTGTLVNDQTPNFPVDREDVVTKEVKAQALIYSGESDWSLQGLEQSPAGAHLDWAMFKDLGESLDQDLEIDLITGKGEAFNEALGLLEISGINTIENAGAVEPKVAFGELAKAKGAIGRNRKRPPDAWLMTTAREAWLGMGPDTEQRPLILTDNMGQEWPESSMGGTAVYLDDAIPITWKTNQEPVFCVRSDDFILWHSPVRTAVMEEPLSGSMGVRFLLYRTTASMLHRYPSGITAVTGAGMKAQQGATEYSYA
jgi:hypothetical protein